MEPVNRIFGYLHGHPGYTLTPAITIVAIKIAVQIRIQETEDGMKTGGIDKAAFEVGEEPTSHGSGKIVDLVFVFSTSWSGLACTLVSSRRFLRRSHGDTSFVA
jgi:hypothetical protein